MMRSTWTSGGVSRSIDTPNRDQPVAEQASQHLLAVEEAMRVFPKDAERDIIGDNLRKLPEPILAAIGLRIDENGNIVSISSGFRLGGLVGPDDPDIVPAPETPATPAT